MINTSQNLNLRQNEAIQYGDGPLMIVAGAGTGKTTVITKRIEHFITSQRAKPEEILALTFTEKASQEMIDRVDTLLPYGVIELWISTFHAFCDRVLRRDIVSLGMDPGFTVMTEAETVLFLRRHLFDLPLSAYRPLGNPHKFLRGLITHFSRLKDEAILPTDYEAWAKEQHVAAKTGEEEAMAARSMELAASYRVYEELKMQESVADYADLIIQTLRLFRLRPEVLSRYQEQFRYVLIDEFQDTNIAQNELAILLAGKSQNITVVGDDDQAIYRFRGAAVSNMVTFRKHFPDVHTVVLTENYRSTSLLLDASYRLVQGNNPDRLEIVEGIDKRLTSGRKTKGDPITFFYENNQEDEADVVAQEIRSLVDSGKYKYADIALLVRANAHSETFDRAMRRRGIPFQFSGPGQLFRQSEIKDLIAYLTVLSKFDDTSAMYRLLSMEWVKVTPRDVASLVTYAKRSGISLFESMERYVLEKNADDMPEVSKDGRGRLRALYDMMLRHMERMKTDSAGQILYYFLKDTGILDALTQIKSETAQKQATNIATFFNKLKAYESSHEDASVFTVVEWVHLSMELGESPQSAVDDWSELDAVHILTVHSAKGLEFPVIFLGNLVAGRFPSMDRKDQIPIPDEILKDILPSGNEHIQEERRLFYVAMTRAKDLLYFSAAKYYGEGKRIKKLSPFVAETLGQDHVLAVYPKQIKASGQLQLLDWEPKTDANPRIEKKEVTYLSYSQIETFRTCPLQYAYRHRISLPVPPGAAVTFGDTMHRTVKSFYEQVKSGIPATPELLERLFETQWVSKGFGSAAYEQKMKEKGRDLLKLFYRNHFDPAQVPLSLEVPFRVKITPTLTIGGKIDRIDRLSDNRLEIIDYKTGNVEKKNPETDEQLTIYALAAADSAVLGTSVEHVLVSFYFFESGKKVSATRTEEQLESTKNMIRDVAQEIEQSNFKPTPGKHCEFCEFRMICDAWR